MDYYIWIWCTTCINFTSFVFLVKQRSLSNTNTNSHLVCTRMGLRVFNFSFFLINHHIIINVNFFSSSIISCFPDNLGLFLLFKLFSTFLTFLFHAFDVVDYITGLSWRIIGLHIYILVQV